MKSCLIIILYLTCFSYNSRAQPFHANNTSHEYNGYYAGKNLDRVAFPIGGLGAGMFCLEGTGAISHLSVKNQPEMYNEPMAFAAISVRGAENGAKVLEAPVPTWKLFGMAGTGNGGAGKNYGLPRFSHGRFIARFPFASIELSDEHIPLEITVTAWSPFIPTDEDNSSLPCGALEYQFINTSKREIEAVFSYNAKNFISQNGRITSEKNGFRLTNTDDRNDASGFAVFVDDNNAVVDHCWFRGGWFDAMTILWKNIENGEMPGNAAVDGISPGASVYVPVELEPGAKKTIIVNFCWYLPQSDLTSGLPLATGYAFRDKPSTGTSPFQQTVSGYAGKQLVNSFDPAGDGQTGSLQSAPFTIDKRYLKFLVGGGNDTDRTAVKLLIDGVVRYTATGNQSELLQEHVWDLEDHRGSTAEILIVDKAARGWGHILADQFVLTDNAMERLLDLSPDARLLEDFEGDGYGEWRFIPDEQLAQKSCKNCETVTPRYKPWYGSRFKDLKEVIDYWRVHYNSLRKNSELFRDAFYNSTLPPEVIEAIAANLTIIKSPTVLRQADGSLWGWEGCSDKSGCCPGSCTHVWNYAQAIPHLFPSLERSLRETEFNINQDDAGHQVFRATLPIARPIHDFHAASDGQLGGIMKVYREWRISGDTEWMKSLYPSVKSSLDYCIETWDPRHTGVLEEPHHNTYDIEFWGPNGMSVSFYTGALSAFVEMSKALGKTSDEYQSLLLKGKEYMEQNLFNGEYFIQDIRWTGLDAPDPSEVQSFHTAYSKEAREILKQEGPKYQYGKGCLSDGVLGMWLASACGLEEVIDSELIKEHLESVHQYNLKADLSDHVNPQRPTYACGDEGGLLLCTWPKGNKPSLPFVYSNEVWTGIEYQVAGHLMSKGEVQKGLEIVRYCRNRYDGTVRNPFNEYECGHWYARAMSSYGMLQGLTGVRYDAVDRILYIDTRIGDFTSFISTETGFGNVGLKDGEPFLHVVYGDIDPERVLVSGREKQITSLQ